MRKKIMSFIAAVSIISGTFPSIVTLAADTAAVSDIYVSSAATVGGDGSIDKPYTGIADAVNKVKMLDKNQNITVHIAEGQYDTYEPIVMDSSVSVHDGYSLRIVSETADFSKEKIGGARLFGGEIVPNSSFVAVKDSDSPYKADIPEEYQGKIYVAQLDTSKGKFNTLYEKGERLDVARTPNRNSSLSNARGPYFNTAYRDNYVMYDPEEFDTDLLIPKRVNGEKQGLDSIFGELQTYIWADSDNHAWTSGTGEITYLDPVEAKFQQNAGGSGTAGTSNGYPNRFFVQNNLGLLDAEGEWFYDSADGRLYVYPRNDINETQIVVPRTDRFVKADGIKNVTFEGMAFACTDTKIPFKSSWNQEGEGQYYGAIDIRNSDNINVYNCNIRQIGMSALLMRNTDNSTVRGCLVENIALAGIVMIGKHGLVESCRVKKPCELNPNFNGVNICDSYMTVARNLEISGSSRYALGFGGPSYAHQETADYFRGETSGSRLVMQYIRMMENAQDSGDTAPLYTVGAGNGYYAVDQMLSINNHADPAVLDRSPGGIYDDRDGANTFYKNVMTWDNSLPAYREDPDRVENKFENVSWLYKWQKEKWAVDNIDENGNCIDPNYIADLDNDGELDAPIEKFEPFTLYVNNETGEILDKEPEEAAATVELDGRTATVSAAADIDNASLIVAGYDGDILKELAVEKISLAKGEIKSFTADIDEAESYRAMLWNSLEGMQPINANTDDYSKYELGVVAIKDFYRSDKNKSHSNTGTVYDETAEQVEFDVEKIEMNKIGLDSKFPSAYLYNVDHMVLADDSKILYSSEDPWKIGTLELWSDQGGALPENDEWELNVMGDKPFKTALKDNAYTKFTTYGKQISWIGEVGSGNVKFYEVKDRYEYGKEVNKNTEVEIQPTNVINNPDGTTEYEFNMFSFDMSHTVKAVVSKGVKSYGFEYNENPEAQPDPFEYEDRVQTVPSNKSIEIPGINFIQTESSVSAANIIEHPNYERGESDYFSAKDPILKGLYSGSYLVYDVSDYDMSKITGISLRMSNASSMNDLASVYIDIRENDIFGRVLGTVKYTPSNATNRFRYTTAGIKPATAGTKKICIDIRNSCGAEMRLNNLLLLTSPKPTVSVKGDSYSVEMNVKDYQTRPNFSKGKLVTALIENGEVKKAAASLINQDLLSPSTPVTFTNEISGSGELEIVYYDTHQGLYAYKYENGEVKEIDPSASAIMKRIIYTADDIVHVPFNLDCTNLNKGTIDSYNLSETEQVTVEWSNNKLDSVSYINSEADKTAVFESQKFEGKTITVTSLSDLTPVNFEANGSRISFTVKKNEKYRISITDEITDNIKVVINGVPTEMKNKPEIIDNIVMIPIGEVMTKLGDYSIIQWNESGRMLLRNIHIGNTDLNMLPESKVWKNGDWYVPAEYLEERFGASRLTVDSNGNAVMIRYFENNPYSYDKGVQAKIGDKEYKTLNAAVLAAEEGDVITVIGDDTSLSAEPVNKNVTITSDGDRTITASYFEIRNRLTIGDNNRDNGVLTIDGQGASRFIQASAADTLTINSDVVIKNFNGDSNGVLKSNGSLTINGAVFEDIKGTGLNAGYQGQIYLTGDVTVNSDMKAYIDAGKTGVISVAGTISGTGRIILDYSTHNTDSYNLVTFVNEPTDETVARFTTNGGTKTNTPKAAFMDGDKFIGGAVVVSNNALKLTGKKKITADDGITLVATEYSPATSDMPYALGGDIAGDKITFRVADELIEKKAGITVIGANGEYDITETEPGVYTFIMSDEAVEIKADAEIDITVPEPIGEVVVNDITIKSGGSADKSNTLTIGGNVSKKFDNTSGDSYLYIGDCMGSSIEQIEMNFGMKQWFGANNGNASEVGVVLVPVGYSDITSDNIEAKATADNAIMLAKASFSQNTNNVNPTALSTFTMYRDGTAQLINPEEGDGIDVVQRSYTSAFNQLDGNTKYHAILWYHGGLQKREFFIHTIKFVQGEM